MFLLIWIDPAVVSGRESKDVNLHTSERIKENEEGVIKTDESSKSIEISKIPSDQNNHSDLSQNANEDSNQGNKETINPPSTEKNLKEIHYKTSDSDDRSIKTYKRNKR